MPGIRRKTRLRTSRAMRTQRRQDRALGADAAQDQGVPPVFGPSRCPASWEIENMSRGATNLKWRRANQDRVRAYGRKWYWKYREAIAEKRADDRTVNRHRVTSVYVAWCAKNPDKIKRYRLSTACKRAGATIAQYDSMLVAQDGLCAVCLGKCKRSPRLSIDHCHKTGKVRGLLCHQCNAMLGMANDSSVILRRAAEYLDSNQLTKICT